VVRKNEAKSTSSVGWKRNPFLWVLVGLSLVTLAIGVWQWQLSRRVIAEQSRPASLAGLAPAQEFTLTTTDGKAVSLSALRGQVVLLNFWATWCPPCKAEMPDLNALQRDYGAKKRFTVVGIASEESPGAVAAFASQLDISFPLLLDTRGQVANDYKIRTLPSSVIVDRDGRIRDMWTGPLIREAVLARLEKIW
jgi:peroxiredoxin